MTEPTQEEIKRHTPTDDDYNLFDAWAEAVALTFTRKDVYCLADITRIPAVAYGIFIAERKDKAAAELQAKIDRLEIGMVELERVAAEKTARLHAAQEKHFKRITTLEAELAARDFVPISDVHKDGGVWLLGKRYRGIWMIRRAMWRPNSWWAYDERSWDGRSGERYGGKFFTHAAYSPKPSVKEGE